MRYHKNVYFPKDAENSLQDFTGKLNNLDWKYSKHCIDKLNGVIDLEQILTLIKEHELDFNNIFEYYMREENIVKCCYRIPYDNCDIILVVNDYKNIVTIYLNSKDDEHVTLRREQYCQN